MSNIKISTVIPAYNAEKYLAQAIESVLAQSLPADEIIVANDGSTDGTADVARSFAAVRYVCQKNQGPPAARNLGLAHSTGQLIAFLDADDLWPTHKLAEQSAYLQAHPEMGCVVGRWQNFLQQGIDRPSWMPERFLGSDAVILGLQASLIHRRVFDAVGPFNTDFRISDDLEWFVRVREAGIPIGFQDAIMVHRRIHDSNISENQAAVARATLRIVKAHLDRQRLRRPLTAAQAAE